MMAALLGGSSVALGAFAAHALRPTLEPKLWEVFQTGVQYQQFHALALLAVAVLAQRQPSPWLTRAAAAFVMGCVLFSGSLYALALSGVKILGIITPIGGITFLLGWLFLGLFAWQQKSRP